MTARLRFVKRSGATAADKRTREACTACPGHNRNARPLGTLRARRRHRRARLRADQGRGLRAGRAGADRRDHRPAARGAREAVQIACEAPDDELLLADWLNALVYEMAVRRMLFGRFQVELDGTHLHAQARGEPTSVRAPPARRWRSRAPPTPRCAWRAGRRRLAGADRGGRLTMDLHAPESSAAPAHWEIPAQGAMRVPARDLRQPRRWCARWTTRCYEQAVNVAMPAGHRARLVRDARRALGLRLPDRRRGGLRRRRRRRGLGRRRRLRRLLRRALPAHRAAPRRHHGRAAARWPMRCSRTSRPASAAPARSGSTRADGRHAHRRREVGGASAAGAARPTWSASRSTARCCTPSRAMRLGAGQAAPARRDGHAGQRQPLPGGAGGDARCSTTRIAARLRPARRATSW